MSSSDALNGRTSPKLLPEGSSYGRLTAIGDFEMRKRSDGRNRAYQKFTCTCGNFAYLPVYSVKNGNTSSCGCLHTEITTAQMTTHGLSKTSAYRVRLNKARRAQKRAKTYTSEVDRITATTLEEILQEYDYKCWICELPMDVVQWDHVHPLSKGGAHVRSNLRPSCKHCNGRKGSIHPFTDELKEKIANDVRAIRTPQNLDGSVSDGLEV